MYTPTLLQGFAVVQGGEIDSRLNHYFLEHAFSWAAVSGYDFPLWSPPLYYPAGQMLALSDNLLGSAPLYGMFRLLFGPVLSYQLWLMGLSLLSFLSMAAVLRRLGVSRVASLTGAYVFAFGLAVQGQVGHPQLLGQFYAPAALYFLLAFLRAPTVRRLALAALFTFLQLAAGVYLGWFLILGLGVFTAGTLLLDRQARLRVREACGVRPVSMASVPVVAAVVSLSFMRPYLQMSSRLSSGWDFDTVRPFLHPFRNWMLPNPVSLPHELWMPPSLFPSVPEGPHTLGVTGWILFAAMAVHVFQNRKGRQEIFWIWGCLFTVCLLVLLSATLPGGITLWSLIHRLVPGAKAIRAVNRIWVVVYLFLILGGMSALSAWLRTLPRRRGVPVILAFCLLVGVENIKVHKRVHDHRPSFGRSRVMADLLEDADAGYIVASPNRDGAAELLDAMWAGLMAKTPVINGTSSRPPPGYPVNVLTLTTHQIQAWVDPRPERPLRFRRVIPFDADMRDSWVDRSFSDARSVSAGSHPSWRVATIELPIPLQYGVRTRVLDVPERVEAGAPAIFTVAFQNTGSFIWRHQWPDLIQASGRWFRTDGQGVAQNPRRTPLPRPVSPGEWVVVDVRVEAPPLPGQYTFHPTLVWESVAWFYDQVGQMPPIPVRVEAGREFRDEERKQQVPPG